MALTIVPINGHRKYQVQRRTIASQVHRPVGDAHRNPRTDAVRKIQVMDVQGLRGVRQGPIGGRIVAVAIVSVVAVVAMTIMAVALAPPHPPGSLLVGATWQWSGTTESSAGPAIVVPDPSRYTIEFMADRTFRASADCITVSGTYVRILPGRTGVASIGLRLRPDPYSTASCGPDSLAGPFLEGLGSAARYVIADSKLTILRVDQGTMTFEVAAVPAARADWPARPAPRGV